jgi:hypothetical protein
LEEFLWAFFQLHHASAVVCLGGKQFWTWNGKDIRNTLFTFGFCSFEVLKNSRFLWFVRILIGCSEPSLSSLHYIKHITSVPNSWSWLS